MPTPKYHGGADIARIPMNLPGAAGLNTQHAAATLGPEWATKLQNSVIDESSRIAARKGWLQRSVDANSDLSGRIVQLYEYQTHAGTYELLATTTDNNIHSSTNNGDTWTDVTGTAIITDPNIQFVNFLDDVYGCQPGGTFIKYSGSTFADYAPTGAPALGTGRGLAAFGRMWVSAADGFTIEYCALLDGANWDTGDSGSINLQHVWNGVDTVQHIAEFNGTLVVFGKKNIVIYADGQGTALGLDPANIYVVDTIEQVGCLARDSVQHVNGDLWFLSDIGVQSLKRLFSERGQATDTGQKQNPLQNLSANVQDSLRARLDEDVTNPDNIRSVYAPGERFYLVSLPSSGTTSEVGACYCFETSVALPEGAARVAGIWDQFVPRAMVLSQETEDLYAFIMEGYPLTAGSTAVETMVGVYSGNLDSDKTYVFDYESAWLNFDAPTIKILKRADVTFSISGNSALTFKVYYDFARQSNNYSLSATETSTAAEFNLAEFNLAEWGGGDILRLKRVPLGRSGEYIKIGFTVPISSFDLSIQHVSLLFKHGRIA